jgi:hypothetical protein
MATSNAIGTGKKSGFALSRAADAGAQVAIRSNLSVFFSD